MPSSTATFGFQKVMSKRLNAAPRIIRDLFEEA
jgi:hypothetical protein